MLTGRQDEFEIISKAIKDYKSHFIAVYGRRRVGKTFLIRESCDYRFTFQHAGMSDGTLHEQLFSFANSLKDAGLKLESQPKNWLEAFESLKDLIRTSTEQRKIIFIDELSWMDTPKSDLIKALENFWNGWASGRKDVVLIVCASATSWMMSKIIHNKGGLYNRLTEQINLKPFTLAKCEDYVRSEGISINRDQILQYYMVFGGVPYYWTFIRKGLSVPQNIDQMFFSENAPLRDEFDYLFASIFKRPEKYLSIVEALATRKIGMSREDIISDTGITNSGDFSQKLNELESCGFIRKYYAFGKNNKDAIYQLTDPFTLFYYKFMKKRSSDENFWSNQINQPAVNTWMGIAFERVCLDHVKQIKQKLGISGVLTEVNSWQCKADTDKGLYGSQIDLLIVRKDQIINLCEMKYSSAEYTITKDYDMKIRRKVSDLQKSTKTKYAIFPTMVTTYGLVDNSYALNIQSTITLDDLFAQ